jgi:Putative beta-barrel porin-2, OmpL-like. bbp2
MTFSRGLSVIGLLAVGGVASAADAPAAPAAPVPSFADLLTGWGLTTSGYVAGSWYHSNGYPANIHQFDTKHDTFQLDEAGLQIGYQPKQGFGAFVDIIAGEDGRILNAAESTNGSNTGMFDVRQAYVQYATGPLTIIGGKFVTLAGAEVINPTGNTNFSRSILFFDSEPLTHTGFRATYALNDTFNLIAGINNGWNTTNTDYGSKTGEAGLAWTPNKVFSLTAQAYFGKAGSYSSFDSERTLVDVVATYNATSSLTFILNADWDQQQDGLVDTLGHTHSATWGGIAGYVNYAFNDQWRVSTRLEYYDDKDGFTTGVVQHLWEGTVTFGYSPVKSFELRGEFRYDRAQDSGAFVRGLNPTKSFGNNLSEIAIQGVYKFSAP